MEAVPDEHRQENDRLNDTKDRAENAWLNLLHSTSVRTLAGMGITASAGAPIGELLDARDGITPALSTSVATQHAGAEEGQGKQKMCVSGEARLQTWTTVVLSTLRCDVLRECKKMRRGEIFTGDLVRWIPYLPLLSPGGHQI